MQPTTHPSHLLCAGGRHCVDSAVLVGGLHGLQGEEEVAADVGQCVWMHIHFYDAGDLCEGARPP
jgi:hypothetical protein